MPLLIAYMALGKKVEIKNNENLPLVSILIPIHKPNSGILRETLTSISEANYPLEHLDILIGDDTFYRDEEQEKIKDLLQEFNQRFKTEN